MNFASLIIAFSEGKNEVPSNLVLLVIMQLFYVIDYFWCEEGILVSRDIVHEGLGFNISMQFLMIPFTFCTQTRYVATTGYTSSWMTLLGIFIIYGTCIIMFYNEIYFQQKKKLKRPIIVHLFSFCFVKGTGYWIYRASNLEKNKFRQNPDDPALACTCNSCNGHLQSAY